MIHGYHCIILARVLRYKAVRNCQPANGYMLFAQLYSSFEIFLNKHVYEMTKILLTGKLPCAYKVANTC